LDAIAFTASRRRLPAEIKPLRELMSPTQDVLASAATTALENASSIELSLFVRLVFRGKGLGYCQPTLNIKDDVSHRLGYEKLSNNL
jgi:hypothetical protein